MLLALCTVRILPERKAMAPDSAVTIVVLHHRGAPAPLNQQHSNPSVLVAVPGRILQQRWVTLVLGIDTLTWHCGLITATATAVACEH